MREVWLDWFYQSDTDTDSDALAFFASIAAAYGPTVLRFGHKGRGPGGRFVIDRLIEFTHASPLFIDFGQAMIRFTTASAQLRYSSIGIVTSGVQSTDYFVVRNGDVQISAAAVKPFFWNFPYRPSRNMGTGYAENLRIFPQDTNDTGQYAQSMFVTKNTWFFAVNNCHLMGPPRVAGSLVADSCAIEQQGLCVVTTIDQATEGMYFDKVIRPSHAAMVGVTGTFTTGSYASGNRLRQGANIATFGRNDGGYGYTYSLYDEVGTLTTGAADVLDPTGTVVGSFTIATIGRYNQSSEALQVKGGSTFINSNYFANYTSPANPNGTPPNKLLNWGFHDVHVAYYEGFLKLDGIAGLQTGIGCYPNASAAGKTCFEISNGDNIRIDNTTGTTNTLGGKWFKGRNITAGSLSFNTTYWYECIWDLDNTVKDFNVEGNSAYTLGLAFSNLNTGNRYNATSTRGIRFKNNGAAGIGFDIDDNRRIAWSPTVTSQSGSIGAYTIIGGYYNISDGVLTATCKIRIDNRGTASGSILVTAPQLPAVTGATNIGYDFGVTGSINNYPAFFGYSNSTGKLESAGVPDQGGNAFSINGAPGNYGYFITFSVPVQYN